MLPRPGSTAYLVTAALLLVLVGYGVVASLVAQRSIWLIALQTVGFIALVSATVDAFRQRRRNAAGSAGNR